MLLLALPKLILQMPLHLDYTLTYPLGLAGPFLRIPCF